MSRDMRLLYFKGCPNVEQARANMRAAMTEAGLTPTWEETDLEAADCPERWKGFPSPTVLMDGADIVSGATVQAGSTSCRFGGAPGIPRIAQAINRRSWLPALSALPAAIVSLLPAAFCPACYPALAGLFGAIGLGAFAERLLAPLTAMLLLIALAGLAYQGRRGGGYRPLAAGALGAAAMYAGQFLIGSSPLKIAGIVLLIAASFWNVLRL